MSRIILLPLLAGVVALTAVADARKVLEQARSATERALERAEAGRWSEADEILQKALTRLPEGEPTREARAALQFSRGWVLAQQSQAGEDQTGEARAGAERAYREVLREYPANPQAAVNLAQLLESSKPDQAFAVLDSAERAGATDFLLLGLARGDMHLRLGNAAASWDAWQAIAARDPANSAVHDRLVRIFPLLPADRHQALFDYCRELDRLGLRQLAGQGMEDLTRLTSKSNPELAERALLRWVEQQVQQGYFSQELLARLPSPAAWPSPALSGLHELAAGRVAPDGWWQRQPERRHVASGALRVLADREAVRGNDERAMALYRLAMTNAPPVQDYNQAPLQGQRAAKLDAAIPLTRLLHRRGDSSEHLRELDGLIESLWEEKTQQYANWNLLGIVQYHRVLGVVHSDLEQYDQATYHLSRVIDFEQRWAAQEHRAPKPQPEVHALLAKGWEHRGDLDEAAKQHVLAARGYLLSNDPAGAGTSLASVKKGWNISAECRAEVKTMEATTAKVDRFLRLPDDAKARELKRLLESNAKAPLGASQVDAQWQSSLLANLERQVSPEDIAKTSTIKSEVQAVEKVSGSGAAFEKQEKQRAVPELDPRPAVKVPRESGREPGPATTKPPPDSGRRGLDLRQTPKTRPP